MTSNVQLNGFVIFPDNNKLKHFDITEGSLSVPALEENQQYTIVISKNSSQSTETKYSIGIDGATYDLDAVNAFYDTSAHEPNDNDETYRHISSDRAIVSYLHSGDIDYWKIVKPAEQFVTQTGLRPGETVTSSAIKVSFLRPGESQLMQVSEGTIVLNGVDTGSGSVTVERGDSVAIKALAPYGVNAQKHVTLEMGYATRTLHLSSGDIDIDWSKKSINFDALFSEYVYDLKVDKDGYVLYVGKWDYTSTQGSFKAFLSKKGADGSANTVSTSTTGFEQAPAVVLSEDSAYLYEVLMSSSQYGYSKRRNNSSYSLMADQLTTKTSDEVIEDIVVDTSAQIYMAGSKNNMALVIKDTQGSGTDFTINTVRYGSSTTAAEHLYALAPEGSSAVYLCGYTDDGTQRKALVVKVNASGAKMWSKEIGGAFTEANAIAVDSMGDLYVAGTTTDTLAAASSAGGHDAFLIKLNPSGTVLWIRQYGTSADEKVAGVGVDSEGNSFIAGTISTGSFSGNSALGGSDLFVTRFDREGVLFWTKQYGTVFDDEMTAIALDKNGTVHTSGNYVKSPGIIRSLITRFAN